MTTRQYRKRIELGRLSFVKATILMGILTLTSCAPQHFVMMSHQAVLHPTGEIWLQWSEFERGQYVAAYAEGMNEGFRHGCETALEATMPPEKGERFLEANARCGGHAPFSGQNLSLFVSPITSFFQKYPEHQKQLNASVDRILQKLNEGRTIEELHAEFSPP
jgi:hypothetical protein